MRQACYHSSIGEFLGRTIEEVLGFLNQGATDFAQQWTITTVSWKSFIKILQTSLRELTHQHPALGEWAILIEYELPRIGKRIDAVIIANELIFVIEFKYDRSEYLLADRRQVEEYAMDLIDFHFESKDRTIIPILFAPNAAPEDITFYKLGQIVNVLYVNTEKFASTLLAAYLHYHSGASSPINSRQWEQSEYQPTPTIVQAAIALFKGQQVEAITRTGAEEQDLQKTTNYLIEQINSAKKQNHKIICFVTGVPGSGKTLVGLNVVHEKELYGGDEFNTAYFSGNGPLINVLREALARDRHENQMALYSEGHLETRPVRPQSDREVKTKVQNLHAFIKDGMRKKTPPTERIVVFDEAQRCWNATHFYNKSKRNQNREEEVIDIPKKSEAELLFEFMDRHNGWAVIIALVGSGQEINTGEGGISEWGKAIIQFPHWQVHISPELLTGKTTTFENKLFESVPENILIMPNSDLHLKVNKRSFRANRLIDWVNAVIDNDSNAAKRLADQIREMYPIFISRDLSEVKSWLKNKIIGKKRIGMVATSGALRLRPYGIVVKEEVNEAIWFLNDEEDVRSSYHLEIVATEFAVQGLELDWAAVCWDADLMKSPNGWVHRKFSGTAWQNIENLENRQYLLNKYRVLLTRAREGMIVFVPKGDAQDKTRLLEFYDSTYHHLISCGLTDLSDLVVP